MSGLGARLAGLFLAPPPDGVGAPAGPQPTSPAVRDVQIAAVLAAPADLDAAAGAVAAALRRSASARAAVVCRPRRGDGDPGAEASHLASPAAARLARKLTARELPAAAAGALCRVALPDDPAAAARDLWRVAGAVDVPVVLALPGRVEGFDGVLAQVDRLVLAAPAEVDQALTTIALGSLSALGPVATRAVPPRGTLTRRLAAAGLVAVALDAAAEAAASADPAPPAAEAAFEPPRAGVRA
jgi:hypothetical protein